MAFIHITVHCALGVFDGNANKEPMSESDCLEAWEAINENMARVTYLTLNNAESGESVRIPGELLNSAVLKISIRS